MLLRLLPVVVAGAVLLLTGCSEESDPSAAAPSAGAPSGPGAGASPAPVPGVELPADPLRELVPAPAEAPAGMLPLLAGSGPRDSAAIAAFSADPVAAQASLAEHRFDRAYVAQYASPEDSRVLSVVVVRFADEAGAAADLAGDLGIAGGDVLEAAPVGQQSQLRRQPLPGTAGGELLTLRFRTGRTTWLLAYGAAPSADPAVAVGLGQQLVVREADA